MQINKRLTENQSNLLLLLVGENPLPNAVAACTLASPSSQISLICSDSTKETAKKLQIWLNQAGFNRIDIIRVDEADPVSICKELRLYLDNRPSQSIGLNYTGGTKLMSVHAYRTIEQWCNDKGILPNFSYLDARTLRMIIGPTDPESGEGVSKSYVGRAISLKIEDLMGLHGWPLLNQPNRTPFLPKFATALANAWADGYQEKWKEWKRYLSSPWSELKNPLSLSELKRSETTLSLPDSFEFVRQAFREETNLDPAGFLMGDLAKFFPGIDQPNLEIIRYLDGIWLEHHVLACLEKVAPEARLSDFCQNIVLGTSQKNNEIKFELDAAALRGYQFFGFSCTTEFNSVNEQSHTKQKLFEAYVRTRQIGGDEASVALVCTHETPRKLERQMSEMLYGPQDDFQLNPRVKVFGRADLRNLASATLKWIIEKQGKEEQ